jgi:hypothetical protein
MRGALRVDLFFRNLSGNLLAGVGVGLFDGLTGLQTL